MPLEDPCETDPMTLQGVMYDVDGPEALQEMAECFIEEYLRSGFEPERILALFSCGEFSGPTLAWRTLGEQAIRGIIDEATLRWGPKRTARNTTFNRSGEITLDVLDC